MSPLTGSSMSSNTRNRLADGGLNGTAGLSFDPWIEIKWKGIISTGRFDISILLEIRRAFLPLIGNNGPTIILLYLTAIVIVDVPTVTLLQVIVPTKLHNLMLSEEMAYVVQINVLARQ